MWNIVFLITGLSFISLLIIIFLSKEVINTEENRAFKILTVTNLIGYIIEIGLQISTRTLGAEAILPYLLGKTYLLYMLLWFSFFTVYTFLICLNHDDEDSFNKKLKRIKIVNSIFGVIGSIIILMAEQHIFYDGTKMYSYGQTTEVIKVLLGIYMIVWTILLIVNFKKIKEKKYAPIFIVLVMLGINAVVQIYDPSVLAATMVGTFICYTMFFTIENPDLKMLREVTFAKEQAEKANRAKTDFLSSMSHEIRTPLNAIVGFSDCIADANDLGEAKENAKDIVNASQTLLEIVNGILDISKIEAGKIEIINTKYNARDTFEELAKLITPRMNEKGLAFSYNIAPDLPMNLFGDHANVKKIVTNLLSNACKYTDKGFVHYEVNCINTKDVSKLIISVEDSGRGIKKDAIDKMFIKFQRLDEDRNTTIEGTGLGLAITKQLIELMGGRIIVHTVYGQGSKFTVVLNQRITTGDVVKEKKVKTTLDLNGVRILIVDDTPLNLKVGSKLLEKYGANNIVVASSGFECIERINRGEVYDVILLDDMMPKMSGVETLKKLKVNPNFKIPVIVLTANAITGMREKYLADGFDDYLAKPIEKEQLIRVLNQVLGRSITEDISFNEVRQINDQNIRNEEIPNVIDQEKAEAEREENKTDIIPVEDNIEEILGDQLDMNYKETTMTDMKPIVVDNIEILEEEPNDESIPTISIIQPIPVVTPIAQVPTYDREYLETNGVDVNHALELLGDMDMYNMTISDFVNDVENKWNNIVEYKNTNNMSEYSIEVHSLKSDCKYLGFMKLADISYQHELKSKDNDSNFVNSNFAELEVEYNKVLKIAKEYVEHNS